MPRPARAAHQLHRQRLHADALGGGYWRGARRTRSCSGSTAPPGRAKDELKAYLDRLAEAERRDHRKLGAELDLFSFPDELGSGLPVFHPKGGVIKREMEDYVRRRHIEEGFYYVGTPHISKEGLFHTSGHLPYYEDTMFPPMELEGANYYLKAMNCPMHNLIFRVARAVLPRAAAAVLRVRQRLPLREVRRRARADPRARADAGRLALLRHPRAGARRDQAPARLRARRCCATSGWTTTTSSCRPARRGRQVGQVHRLRRGVGDRDRGAARRSRRVRARPRRRPGRRGVLRPEDLGPGAGRHRAHLADVDHPVRLQPARAASAWSTRRPTAPASSR